MSDFRLYAETGLYYGLGITNQALVLLFAMLAVSYSFKDWKKLLLLIAVFSIGSFVSLLLSSFGIVTIKMKLVVFLIPLTVLITALYNLFTAGKSAKKESVSILGFLVFCFGIIHGLAFAAYFNAVFSGKASEKIGALIAFAIGIEGAQLTVVLALLILSYVIHTFFRFSKRDFILVLSAFVIGVIVPLLIKNEIWK